MKNFYSLPPVKVRSIKKTILHLLTVGALAACSSGPENPVGEAAVAIEQQDYRSARIHLLTALRENAQDPEANFMFAKVLTELGDAAGADAALKKLDGNTAYAERIQPLLGRVMLLKGQNEDALALSESPVGEVSPQLHAIKAMALLGLGRTVEAEAVLAKALQATPGNAELLWIKGNRDLEIGNIDSASRNASLALKTKPDSMEALMLAGRLALAKADGKKALRHFSKVREVRPDNLVAEYMRGAVYRNLGDRSEARKCFETVLSNAPDHPLATYFLALMDYEEGKSDKAYQRLQSSKADMDAMPQALRLAGLLEFRRGSYEQTIKKLNRYLAQNNGDGDALVILARALSAAGNDAEAFRVIAPLARLSIASEDVLKWAAQLAAKAESTDAASFAARNSALAADPVKNKIFEAEQAIIGEQWLRAAKIYDQLLTRSHPQKVMLLNNAAMVQLSLARANDAVKFAKQAHELAPDDPVVKDTLGWILLQTRQDKAAALELLQEAAAAAPRNPEIRWHLVQALAANGKKDDARKLVASLEPVASGGDRAEIDNLLAWL